MREFKSAVIGTERKSRSNLVVILLVGVLSVMYCSRADACLNDRETARAEEEFRSRYQTPAQEAVVNHSEVTPLGWIAMGLGVGLTAGSVVVAIGRERRRIVEKSSH